MSSEAERKKFSGRDLAEALSHARQHFGLPRQDIGYTIVRGRKVGPLDETATEIEIEAWPEPGANPLPPPREERPRRDDRRGGRGRGDGPPRGGRDRGDRGDRHGHGRGHHGDDRPHREYRDRDRDRHEDDAPVAPPDLVAPADITDPIAVVSQLASGLASSMGIDIHCASVEPAAVGIRVKLEGEDAHLLTEDAGAGLEALQSLAQRMLQKDGRVEARVTFDADGWREAAEGKLMDEARRIAEEVRTTGKSRKMPPMGPYERRLLHLALSGEEGIRTFSSGTGHGRRLHIAPAGSPDTPDDATE